MIKDKMFIQSKFISLDIFSVIDIGVLNNLVKGTIYFDQNSEVKKQRFLSNVFKSVAILNK